MMNLGNDFTLVKWGSSLKPSYLLSSHSWSLRERNSKGVGPARPFLGTSSPALAVTCLLPQGSVKFLDCKTCKRKCSSRSKFSCRREEDIFEDEFKIAGSTQTDPSPTT